LTAGDRSDDVGRCERLGLDAYLMKPINQSELFDTLVEVLRCPAEDARAAMAESAAGRAELSGLRVLLAEDSLYNQKLALALLERKGHHVLVANNGSEAVQLARTQPFDLVLMDLQMPEMDGLQATKRIRDEEAGSGRRLPIVAMTAQAMKGDRERCLEAGMDDYLTKPVRAAQLYEKIDFVVGTARDRQDRSAPPGQASIDERTALLAAANITESFSPLAGSGARAMTLALKAVDGDPELLHDVAK